MLDFNFKNPTNILFGKGKIAAIKAYTLPLRQISNGVVDAFVHVVEQYLTYPVNAKVQDRFAKGPWNYSLGRAPGNHLGCQ